MPVRAFSQSGASSIHCSLEGMKEAFVSVEKTKISKRIQRFLVQRGGGGGRKGERKSQFSTESSSRVSKKAPEVADDSSLSLSLSLSSRARKKRGRDLNSKRICLGKKKNSRAFVTFVTTTARLLFEQQERRENDDDDDVVVARKVFAGEKIVVFIVLCTSFFRVSDKRTIKKEL